MHPQSLLKNNLWYKLHTGSQSCCSVCSTKSHYWRCYSCKRMAVLRMPFLATRVITSRLAEVTIHYLNMWESFQQFFCGADCKTRTFLVCSLVRWTATLVKRRETGTWAIWSMSSPTGSSSARLALQLQTSACVRLGRVCRFCWLCYILCRQAAFDKQILCRMLSKQGLDFYSLKACD